MIPALTVQAERLRTLAQDRLSGIAVTHYEIGFPTLEQGYELRQEGLLPQLLITAYQQMAKVLMYCW